MTLHVGVDPAFVPATKTHPALRCAEYGRAIARLRERGVAVTPDPIPFDGHDHCYIDDPFGNRIELIASQTQKWPCAARTQRHVRTHRARLASWRSR